METRMNKITKTEPEWRAQLDDIQYQVTRKHATETSLVWEICNQ